MTDLEKKAEEYAKSEFPNDEFKQQIAIKALSYGYEQGQNETEEKIFNEWCKGESPYPNACGFLLKLQKENEELKILSGKQTVENKMIRKQIEKMKHCSNCSKSRVNRCCPYWHDEFACKHDNYKEWELLE